MRIMTAIIGLVVLGLSGLAQADYAGVGRDATANEIKAWDIDVRPDFKGLPAGQGSVEDGEELWEAKCTVCHGDFGDANHVFAPIIGNTTQDDIKTGRVASLQGGTAVRTTFSKVATVSTLWDYIHRAMPWNAPKSLSADEVYALLAYLLNLAEIVPDDFVLSDQNIAEVQARMPNRHGMTRDHGLWAINDKPDTANKACMKNCKSEAVITSQLPDYAINAHGNLADQNRNFGAVRGRVTDPDAASADSLPEQASRDAVAMPEAVERSGCSGCHRMGQALLGPSFNAVMDKYAGQAEARSYLTDKIVQGGSGVWGQIAMPPQPQLSADDLNAIVVWLTGPIRSF